MHTAGKKHRIINIVACVDATDSESANAIDRAAWPRMQICCIKDVVSSTHVAKIWKVIYLAMKRREQHRYDNAQQIMKGTGGADTVEHDDHNDQICDEEIKHLQKRSTLVLALWRSAICVAG